MPDASAPPLHARALEALGAACSDAGIAFDPEHTSFASIAVVVERGLAGPFDPARAMHRAWSLGLAALFGAHAHASLGAFWFPQREVPAGAMLGFPSVLLALDPAPLVDQALANGNVASLDARESELAGAHGAARGSGGGRALGVDDYRALFDPELVHFLVVDEARLARALATPTGTAAAALAHAIAAAQLPDDVDHAWRASWFDALARLDPAAPLAAQVDAAPRAIELYGRLASTVAAGAAADEGFWADVAFRVLRTAAPRAEAPRAEASSASTGASGAGRLLGVFRLDAARPLVPNHPPSTPARTVLLDAGDIRAALAALHAPRRPRGDLVDLASARLDELRALVARVDGGRSLALRRLTLADARDDAATARLRLA